MQTCDVAIIGAGIVGVACAYELTKANLRVCIVEQTVVGGGATSAGQGHLVVLDDSPAQFALARYSLQLWRPILADLPPECEYWQCGTLWVATNEAELEFATRRGNLYNSHGVRAEALSAQQVAELEPNLRPGLAGGLLVPDDATVRPPLAARALLNQAIHTGARLIEKQAVKLSNDGVHLSDGTLLYAGTMINATGNDAATLTPGLPIRSRKGHILIVDGGPKFVNHHVLELGYMQSAHASNETDSVAFSIRHLSTHSGELILGSSRQYGVSDPQVEPKMIAWLLRRAIEFMPALGNARPIRSWTGFRAGTPDGLPIIGPCLGLPRVYAATGHEGLGATTAPATARLLADQILGRTSEIDPAPYLPSRFASESLRD
jgi:D-hydroxyproline dehydrogenase subunit beta